MKRSSNNELILQLQATQAALAAERDEVKRLKTLMTDSIRIIFYAGKALEPLFQGELIGPEPTIDGTAVQLLNQGITVTVAPFAQEIQVIDGSGKIPVAIYKLVKGQLGQDDQIHMIGQINRIRDAMNSGKDPVSDRLNLTGVVASV